MTDAGTHPPAADHREGDAAARKPRTPSCFEVGRTRTRSRSQGAVEKLFKRQGRRRPRRDVHGKAKRMGRFIGQRPDWKKANVRLAPGENRSSSSRACRRRCLSRTYKPTSAGPPLPDDARLLGADSRTAPEKSLTERASARPAAATTTAGSRSASAAAATSGATASSTSGATRRRPGEGRRDRVRPEPHGAHRAAALRRRREALHPRARRPGGRRHASSRRATADIKPGNALPLRYIPLGTTIHNIELKPRQGRPARALGRRRRRS